MTDPYNFAATTNRLDGIDEEIVEIGRIFLGINTDCLGCHDGAGHLESTNLYLSEVTRKQFLRQAAFLGRLRQIGIYNVGGSDLVMDDEAKGYDTGNDTPFFTPSENRFPRTGNLYKPAFILTGEEPRPGEHERAALARMITEHIQFSRTTVNMIWGRLMVVPFVEPYDGFDLARLDPINPPPEPWTVQPTYPELLEALAEDFKANNYSMHHLMKTIMKSSTYQLTSRFPGEWKDDYTSYYARKYVRVMTGAEVADTIAQATGRPYKFSFSGTEVERVKQLTDPDDIGVRQGAGNPEHVDVSAIMNSFFQPKRQQAAPLGNKATTLQAMLMMSSWLVNNRVQADNGYRVEMLLDSGLTDEEVVDDLYLATLARWPTPTEQKAALETFQFADDRTRAAQDLQWAQLNGIEYVLNH